ncbi:MAG TPA: hypothetical protein VIX82_13420, partial [Solirubrobacteraceae bacterium]
QILDMGLADERELDELDAAIREHLDNPDTVVMPFVYFLASGRNGVNWQIDPRLFPSPASVAPAPRRTPTAHAVGASAPHLSR